MPTTTSDLLKSIRNQNFPAAKTQFGEILQDKMRVALAAEYKDVAKTFLTPPTVQK